MKAILNLRTIVSMPFAENTYLLWRPGANEALVIDPGLEPDLILEQLRNEDLTVAAILNTHGHGDHIAGNEAMKQAFPQAPLVIGANEKHLLTDPHANMQRAFSGFEIVSPPADRVVSEGDVLDYAGIRLEVLDVPGHSPGHVAFIWRGEPVMAFAGDVLFREGIGRSDFPGCSGEQLFRSIREKMFALPGNTVVYPGHGPVTTIDHERRFNPFVAEE